MKAYLDLPADANVEAWLVTIAHHKAVDVTRAAARRAISTAELPDTAAAPAAEDPDSRVAGSPSTYRSTGSCQPGSAAGC